MFMRLRKRSRKRRNRFRREKKEGEKEENTALRRDMRLKGTALTEGKQSEGERIADRSDGKIEAKGRDSGYL